MDDRRFDLLAQTVSRAGSRRGALRLLGAGGLAALLTRLGGDEAAARCVKLGKKCDRKEDRCCGGAKCRGGRCKCVGRKKRCGKRCIPDRACCGGCPTGEECEDGQCCLGSGAICDPADDRCCLGAGEGGCVTSASSSPTGFRCCRLNRSLCTGGCNFNQPCAACCNGFCGSGGCCTAPGGACTRDEDCCVDDACVDGVCQNT